jgi:hypothetical protein
MIDVEHISRKGTDVPISWFPVPDESELPEGLQGLFRKARESIEFVPNVFRAYSYRPERHSACWFAITGSSTSSQTTWTRPKGR